MTRSLKNNTIHKMDCIDGMRLIAPNSIDVIVTSPPYNIGIQYNSYNDKKNREEYLNWMNEVSVNIERILNENGSLFLNIGGTLVDPWIPIEVALRFRENGFILQNMIHWINSIAIPKDSVGNYPNIIGDIAVGHYKPINSKRFHHDCHEFVFHFTKNGNVPLDKLSIGVQYQDKSNIGRWKNSEKDLRDRGNAWFIPYKTINLKRPHPSVFPVQLPEMCIRDHGLDKINLILDPFMGIGTTAIACIMLEKDFIGFEIDKDYIKIANNWINEVKKQKCIKNEVNYGR